MNAISIASPTAKRRSSSTRGAPERLERRIDDHGAEHRVVGWWTGEDRAGAGHREGVAVDAAGLEIAGIDALRPGIEASVGITAFASSLLTLWVISAVLRHCTVWLVRTHDLSVETGEADVDHCGGIRHRRVMGRAVIPQPASIAKAASGARDMIGRTISMALPRLVHCPDVRHSRS